MSTQHRFETMQRQAVDIFSGQQHRQYARTGHALFDQLSRFVRGDRCCFATAATVNFADVFDHTDLHWHDIQLLTGFFADDMLAATAGTGQFVLGQFVNDFDAGKISRQWFAFTTAFDRCNDLFVGIADSRHRLAFGFVEQCQLRRVGFDRLFGLATKDTVTQQLDLFFQINDVGGVSFFGVLCFKQHLPKQNRIVREVVGHQFHALDYTRQATNRGVKTLCGRLRQRSNPSSNQFSSWTVSTMAWSVSSGEVLNRSDSKRLSQRQKPLRW
ncbi:hypothetical protein BV357_05712 [Pseudomonas syringae pv. actinidiae]|nr:hypothetical protein BV357_05712 [Pseudomonas syringae pv. actinidiae]